MAIIVSGTITAPDVFASNQRKLTFSNGKWWAFYADSGIIYYKTSNDGSTWSSAVQISTQNSGNCGAPCIWDDGTYIFAVWVNQTTDDVHFRRITISTEAAFPTSVDSRISGVDQGILSNDDETISICKTPNGTLFVSIPDSGQGSIYTSTDNGANWSRSDTDLFLDGTDNTLLVPLTGNQAYVIFTDGNAILGRKFNGSSWATSNTTIVSSAFSLRSESFAFSAVNNGNNVYLAYTTDIDGSTASINTLSFNGTSWTATTAVESSISTPETVSLGLDESNGDIYAVYIKNSTDQIFYKKSTDDMASWGSATDIGAATGVIDHVNVNFSDSNNIGVVYMQSSNLVFTQVVVLISGLNLSLADSFTITDTTAPKTVSLIKADSISISEDFTASLGALLLLLSDSVSFSETFVKAPVKIITDSVSLAEDFRTASTGGPPPPIQEDAELFIEISPGISIRLQ